MTTSRQLIYEALMGHEALQEIVSQRVYASGSLNNVPARPFILIRMHQGYAYQGKMAEREVAQVWFHDEPGDYIRIDAMMAHAREAIDGIASTGPLVCMEWIENSVDLKDDDMHTVCKNARYQATRTTVERT